MTEKKEKSRVIKDTLVLFAITLTAAILLGAVYGITKEPIAKAEEESKLAAYSAVFEGLAGMEEDSELENAANEAASLFEGDPSCEGSQIKEAIVAIDENGKAAGLVMRVSNREGYGGEIEFAMGVDLEGTLKGIEFLTLNETAGLGMKASDESFTGQFRGIKTESFALTKAKIKGETETDAISGATRTTRAVTLGVNGGLKFARQCMSEDGLAVFRGDPSQGDGSGR